VLKYKTRYFQKQKGDFEPLQNAAPHAGLHSQINNPEGMVSCSPALRGTSYPGLSDFNLSGLYSGGQRVLENLKFWNLKLSPKRQKPIP